jgi:hypothetical protein
MATMRSAVKLQNYGGGQNRKMTVIWLLGLLWLGVATALPGVAEQIAMAATLSLDAPKTVVTRGERIAIEIAIDNASDVTGMMVTVAYPSTQVQLAGNGVSSAFFKTMTDTRPGRSAISVRPWQANSAEDGLLYLSAAYIDPNPTTGGGGAYSGPQTLFRLIFQVKPDATQYNLNFNLQQSTLCNLPAGWGNDTNGNGQCDTGEEQTAAVLVKAFGKTTSAFASPTLNDDFESLPASLPANPALVLRLDRDNDGLIDAIEDVCCSDIDNPDSDGDGLKDGQEDSNKDCHVDAAETSPCDEDSDDDQYDDWAERIAGTNPRDPASIPTTVCADAINGTCSFWFDCSGTCHALIQAATVEAAHIAQHSADSTVFVKANGGTYNETNGAVHLPSGVLLLLEGPAVILR